VSQQGIGGQKSTLTTLTADAGDDAPLFSYESWLTLAGSPFEATSLRFTVNHNLTAESRIRGAQVTGARQRLWDYLTEGNEMIEGNITISRKYAKDLQAACPAVDGEMVLSFVDACDDESGFIFTLDDVEILTQGRNIPQDGMGNFELSFNAKGIAVAAYVAP
jgi:hypothetical protein